jgi:hypothetical protein
MSKSNLSAFFTSIIFILSAVIYYEYQVIQDQEQCIERFIKLDVERCNKYENLKGDYIELVYKSTH